MMNIAVIFVVLFVSAQAVPFGFLNPNNLDTPDDGEATAAEAAPAGEAGGIGVAGQAGQTLPPSVSPDGADSSSSSSSEEDLGSEGATGGAAGTTPLIAGPLAGPGRDEGQAVAGAGAGNGDDAIVPAVGGPIIENNAFAQNNGGSSGAQAYRANVLEAKTTLKETEAKQSGALIALTILGVVCGVAGLTIAAYKNRVSITSRYSRMVAK